MEIIKELEIVMDIAYHMVRHYADYDAFYFKAFFPDRDLGGPAMERLFQSMAWAADPDYDEPWIFDITCDREVDSCKKKRELMMADPDTQTLNICPDGFFNAMTSSDFAATPTRQRIDEIKAIIQFSENLPVQRLFSMATGSRAMAFIHALTQFPYISRSTVTRGPREYVFRDFHDRAMDFALGVTDCLRLAKGRFIRRPGRPFYVDVRSPYWCGETRRDGGLCPAELAWMNADSFALLATGVWMSKQVGLQIPLPDYNY